MRRLFAALAAASVLALAPLLVLGQSNVTGPTLPQTFTWAGKPASYAVGRSVWCSNCGVTGSSWYFDGTRWKPVGGAALLKTLDTAVTGLTNVEAVTLQYQMPATLLQLKDRLRTVATLTKSGTTDTCGLRVRLGTAGTTADTGITSTTQLTATGQHAGMIMEHRVETATSVQILARNDYGYGGSNTGAATAATTIANISNSLFWSVNAVSNGTTNTCGITDAQLWLVAPGT